MEKFKLKRRKDAPILNNPQQIEDKFMKLFIERFEFDGFYDKTFKQVSSYLIGKDKDFISIEDFLEILRESLR